MSLTKRISGDYNIVSVGTSDSVNITTNTVTINGNLVVSGAIIASNSSAGVSGQVLISTGPNSAPVWSNSAGTYKRTTYSAAEGQNSFGASYTVGSIAVYVNGLLFDSNLYTANNGSTIVFSNNLTANDIVEIIETTATTFKRTSYTAVQGQTVFTVSYAVGSISVYRNGLLFDASSYTANNGYSIIFPTGCNAGDTIEVIENVTPYGCNGNFVANGSITSNGQMITNSGYVCPDGSTLLSAQNLVLDDISNQFDGDKTVFDLTVNSSTLNTIVDSKDLDIFFTKR